MAIEWWTQANNNKNRNYWKSIIWGEFSSLSWASAWVSNSLNWVWSAGHWKLAINNERYAPKCSDVSNVWAKVHLKISINIYFLCLEIILLYFPFRAFGV